MIEKHRESVSAKMLAMHGITFFTGAEPKNTINKDGSINKEPRTTKLPGGGFEEEITKFLVPPKK